MCVCLLVYSLTSGQHIPGDGVSDGGEDPVELSEGSAPVVEPARDPVSHTHKHTTQMAQCQPRSLYVAQVDSEHKVASARYYPRNTSEDIYIYSL